MGRLDTTQLISTFSIPGTHDSLSKGLGNYAESQSLNLQEQLNAGVRFLDVRLQYVSGVPGLSNGLYASHGGIFNRTLPFGVVVSTCLSFMSAHPTETILMSVKQEESSIANFDSWVNNFIDPNHWWLNDWIPTLAEVTKTSTHLNKIVLIRRFPTTRTLGMNATNWPNNTTFAIRNMKLEDLYDNPPYVDKWLAIESHMRLADSSNSGRYVGSVFYPRDYSLFLTFTSAYYLGGVPGPIRTYSNRVNPDLQRFLPQFGKARVGVVIIDFVDQTLTQLVFNTNTFVR